MFTAKQQLELELLRRLKNAGASNPTLTLSALSLWAADHLLS